MIYFQNQKYMFKSCTMCDIQNAKRGKKYIKLFFIMLYKILNISFLTLKYRCMLGNNAGPANWANSSHLVEAICLALCKEHPSPQKERGATTSRWAQVLSSYGSIRQLVLDNARVMARTSIQLFEINQRTLSQWFVSNLIHGS